MNIYALSNTAMIYSKQKPHQMQGEIKNTPILGNLKIPLSIRGVK